MSSGVDITARKRTEEALRESEERFRQLAEHLDEVLWMVDPKAGQTLYVSPAYERVWGRSRESLYRDTRSFMDAIHPEDRQRFAEAYQEQLRNPKPMDKEYRVMRPDGSMRWICDRSFPVRNAAGEVYRFVGISKDITEQKRATEALARANESAARANEHFRLMFNSVSDALFVFTEDGRFAEVNDSACRYLGYTREELLQLRFTEIVDPKLKLDIPTLMEACLAKGQILYEGNDAAKDGRRIPVEVKTDLIYVNGAPRLICTVRDISDRKNAEKQYRDISDGALEGLIEDITSRKEAAAKIENAREEERTRLARELHDELGQALTGIKMDLASLILHPPKLRLDRVRRSQAILKQIDQTIQSVQGISKNLRPGMLDDLGLVATVEWTAQEFEARTGTKCALELPREESATELRVATALVRILQEALTNIARHAKATKSSVRLAEDGDGVWLEVRDNGKGFHEGSLSPGRSLGILGMRERAFLVDGRLTIISSPGEGATVTAWAPVRRKKAPESD